MTSQESGAKIDNVDVAQVKKREGAREMNMLKANADRDVSHLQQSSKYNKSLRSIKVIPNGNR